jgi:CheY-like chemotaxis protein
MPLNLIIGFSEMMAFSVESYDGVRMPKEYREDVMEIYHSSRHLFDLVEDVLMMAQIEAGKMAIQPGRVDLADIVRDAAETVRPLVEGKGLSLRLSIDPDLSPAYIDAVRIRQVLLNLLNNACRFTETGYIELALRGDGEAIVDVRDTGSGIAPHDISHLFEEFYSSSKDPSSEYSGFGLGLAISKQLVDAHGGSMSVTSELGKGTCFTVKLHFLSDDATTTHPVLLRTPSPKGDEAKPVVLCVSEKGYASVLDRYMSNYRVVHSTPDRASDAFHTYVPVGIWLNEDPSVRKVAPWLDLLLRTSPSLTIVRCRIPTDEDIARRLEVDAFLPKPVTRHQVTDILARLAPPQGICRVLIVDDDQPTVRMVRRMLASVEGLEVAEACGGQEALDYLATQNADVVLLDLAMPCVSGYDVLSAIRHRDDDNTHVVLMTGFGVGEEQTPVYGLSMENRGGFAVPRCLDLMNQALGELSGGVR